MKHTSFLLSAFLAVGTISDTAAGQSPAIPVQSADDSHVVRPRPPIEPDMLGYGTRGVEGRTLREMLDRCAAAASRPDDEVENARCDQLRRTVRNQPGNDAGS